LFFNFIFEELREKKGFKLETNITFCRLKKFDSPKRKDFKRIEKINDCLEI